MKNRIKKPECNIPVLNSFDFSVFLEKLLHVELLLELFNTAAAVNELLLASEERMAC